MRISKSSEERKDEIIKIALELFMKKGYKNTTIADISKQLNIAQGLCYRYFKSKQEIFSAVSDYYAASFVKHLEEPINKELSVIEKFNLVIKRIFEYGIKHSKFEATFKEEPEISVARINKIVPYFSKLLVPIIEKGVEEKSFFCENVNITVMFLVHGLIHTVHAQIPSEHTKEYLISFTESVKLICKQVLQVNEDKIKIGDGWIEDIGSL